MTDWTEGVATDVQCPGRRFKIKKFFKNYNNVITGPVDLFFGHYSRKFLLLAFKLFGKFLIFLSWFDQNFFGIFSKIIMCLNIL